MGLDRFRLVLSAERTIAGLMCECGVACATARRELVAALKWVQR